MATSMEHDGAVVLFEHKATLVPEFLHRVGRVQVPDFVEIGVESANFTQLDPAAFFADALVVMRDADRKPVFATVIEFQRQVDHDKPTTWSVYVATVAHRYRCKVQVLVVTPRRKVADWARNIIEIVPDWPWRPVVIGPDELPPIMDVEAAKRSPELAVLSAFAAAGEDDLEIAVRAAYAAKKACEHLGGERGVLDWNLVDVALNEAQALGLEALMSSVGEKEYGYFARKYLEQGLAKGREEGQRLMLSKQLTLRFGPLPAWATERLETADSAALELLSERLFTAASLEEALRN